MSTRFAHSLFSMHVYHFHAKQQPMSSTCKRYTIRTFVNGSFLLCSQDPQFERKCLYAFENGIMEKHPCEDVRGLQGARQHVPQLHNDVGLK
jgi:hypothetical protein